MISEKSIIVQSVILLQCIVFINTEVNVKRLVIASIQAAEIGAKSIVESKYQGLSAENAYLKSHSVLYCNLAKTFPNVKIVSKLSGDGQKVQCDHDGQLDTSIPPNGHRIVEYSNDQFADDEKVTVWLEPLDGSAFYSSGEMNDHLTISICVAIDGQPEAGVVNMPAINRTTWAWHNAKRSTDLLEMAERDGEFKPRIQAIQGSKLKKLKRLARRKYGNEVKVAAEGDIVSRILDIATLKAEVLIATGAIEKWKTCAGSAIVRSLGGKVTDLMGSLIDYSDSSDVINKRGLLVTSANHKSYVKTFKSLARR